MSTIINEFKPAASPLLQVEEHLIKLRGLYHQIETAASVKKIEREIREKLYSISQEVSTWRKDRVGAKEEAFQEKMSRLKKTFNQVQDLLELELRKPPRTPLLPSQSSENILGALDDELSHLRSLYHQIQKADPIEKIELEMREELHRISLGIKEWSNNRSETQRDDFDDKISRLKGTLYEVEDSLQEKLSESFFEAVSWEYAQNKKMKIGKLRISQRQIAEKIQLYRKRAENLDRRRSYVKQALVILHLNSILISCLEPQ